MIINPDSGEKVEMLPSPLTGRQSKHAWECGFRACVWNRPEQRTFGLRDALSVGRYRREGLRECFRDGWDAAERALQAIAAARRDRA